MIPGDSTIVVLQSGSNVFDTAGYAGAKGVPAPRLTVAATGGLLVVGGASVVLGAFPVVGAAALAAFLVVSAVRMHDFWAADNAQEQQTELTQFLKNVALTGAALGFLAVGDASWPYAAGLGLF